MMQQLPSRFAEVGAASAASLQRLELQITLLQAQLDRIEMRLNGLKVLRKACAAAERTTRSIH
jgi:hypothetical protein